MFLLCGCSHSLLFLWDYDKMILGQASCNSNHDLFSPQSLRCLKQTNTILDHGQSKKAMQNIVQLLFLLLGPKVQAVQCHQVLLESPVIEENVIIYTSSVAKTDPLA